MAEPEEARGFWSELWRRFRADRVAMTGLLLVVAMAAAALAAPLLATHRPLLARVNGELCAPAIGGAARFLSRPHLWPGVDWRRPPAHVRILVAAPIPHGPSDVALLEVLEAPSRRHWLGTDDLGRDAAARILHGARVSLAVGFVAAGIALLIGTAIGALAGYWRGWVDWLLSRFVEVVLCFPVIFLVLAVVASLEPSIWTVMAAIGLTGWTSEARYVRGEFLRIRELEYAVAARASGAAGLRVAVRHILPNALTPVLVSATFSVAYAVLVEGALSFLGLGIQPPYPSWGSMLAAAEGRLEQAWWLALFPGLAIFLTVAAYNLVGEGLRDAADPLLRGQ